MPKLNYCKMLADTNHFNKGQKVWIIRKTGTNRFQVTGNFRGSGTFQTKWLNINKISEPELIEVTEEFFNRISNYKGFGMV